MGLTCSIASTGDDAGAEVSGRSDVTSRGGEKARDPLRTV